MIELSLSDALNNSQRHEAGLLFHSELISYSPLVSILMTTAHPVLNGATVTCITSGMYRQETITIVVTETGNPNYHTIVNAS